MGTIEKLREKWVKVWGEWGEQSESITACFLQSLAKNLIFIGLSTPFFPKPPLWNWLIKYVSLHLLMLVYVEDGKVLSVTLLVHKTEVWAGGSKGSIPKDEPYGCQEDATPWHLLVFFPIWFLKTYKIMHPDYSTRRILLTVQRQAFES